MMGLLQRILSVGTVLLLCDCSSYRPLYGTTANGSNVADSLSAISVPVQRSRTGQLLRNNLLSGLDSSGVSHYELRLAIAESSASVSALAGTNLNRKRYSLSVHYDLVDLASGTALKSGTSFATVSYDTVREPVADLQAADNARDRAADEVSQDLRVRVAAYLSSRKS
jgi:LPS-assembly lipoprotein